MHVQLDGKPLTDCSATTLGEALSVASDIIDKQGRMICEVKVDGQKWSDQRIEDEINTALPAGELCLLSCDARELLANALQDAAEALTVADTLQREAAELIQSDRHDEAMKPLAEAVLIWQSVQQAVLLGLEYSKDETTGGEIAITDAIDQLNRHLTGIRDALQGKDPVGLSDTLLYDLPEAVQRWRSILHEMTPALPEEESRL